MEFVLSKLIILDSQVFICINSGLSAHGNVRGVSRIVRFNGDPASWWIGQMLKYILKPRASLQKAINETVAKMNFKTPIVG